MSSRRNPDDETASQSDDRSGNDASDTFLSHNGDPRHSSTLAMDSEAISSVGSRGLGYNQSAVRTSRSGEKEHVNNVSDNAKSTNHSSTRQSSRSRRIPNKLSASEPDDSKPVRNTSHRDGALSTSDEPPTRHYFMAN